MPSEESYKLIEGTWKDFRFRRILQNDEEAVFDHLAHNYFKDELTSNLLGWSQEYPDNVNRVVKEILKDGLSFLVEHVSTGKIAGVRITANHKPNTSYDGIPIDCKTARLFLKYVHDLVSRAEIEKQCGINTWAEFWAASTSRDFRNQGVASEFYDRSIAFLTAEGFKHAVVCVTSPYTKLATKKRGFKQLARLDHGDFVDFEGNPAFKKEDLKPDDFGLVLILTL